MPASKNSPKDLEHSKKFLLKEIERINKLEKRLFKDGKNMHSFSRGFLDQMIERRKEYQQLLGTLERAIDDLDEPKPEKTQRKK